VPQCAGDARFRDLVVQSGQLSVDTATTSSVTVVRGARRRYSFTVDGPDRVEPEDVPTDVVNVVLGTRFLYSIPLEGAAPSEIPHAVRFARRLAQVLDGAVIDQQTDEVWSPTIARRQTAHQRRGRGMTTTWPSSLRPPSRHGDELVVPHVHRQRRRRRQFQCAATGR
jgi:hypothetical protein